MVRGRSGWTATAARRAAQGSCDAFGDVSSSSSSGTGRLVPAACAGIGAPGQAEGGMELAIVAPVELGSDIGLIGDWAKGEESRIVAVVVVVVVLGDGRPFTTRSGGPRMVGSLLPSGIDFMAPTTSATARAWTVERTSDLIGAAHCGSIKCFSILDQVNL